MLRLRLASLAVLTLSVPAIAQSPYLVKDLDPSPRGTQSSSPGNFVTIGTKVFFTAGSSHPGTGIHVHDAQTNQTDMLKVGTLTGGGPLVAMGQQIFFVAYDAAANTYHLCTSDGTQAGTKAVVALPGPPAGTQLAVAGAVLYLVADHPTAGRELFAWDGNSLQLLDIHQGAGSSEPIGLTASGSALFFSARDLSYGRELWRSDGTPAGTVRVADIWAGEGWSSPYHISARFDAATKQHTLVFSARTPNEGEELWTSDGDPQGTTRLVKDIAAQSQWSSPEGFTYDATNKRYFFSAETDEGRELWLTDLSTNGTIRVKDILPGWESSNPRVFGVHQGRAFLGASDGVHGFELWTSDGTEPGTRMVLDLRPGAENGFGGYALLDTSGANARLLFHGLTSYWALWTSDGTPAGTAPVTSINPVRNTVGAMTSGPNGSVVFPADDLIHGVEPWISDWTAAGTKMIIDADTRPHPSATHSSNPRAAISRLTHVRLFASAPAALGLERDVDWQSDGTRNGTDGTLSNSSGGDNLTELEGGAVVWTALDGNGNRRLRDKTGFLSTATNAANLTAIGARLFFTADDQTHGIELWTSLGTPQTTQMVKDILAGAVGSNPSDLVAFQGNVFFIAANDLWRSDGTAAGTVELKAISRGPMIAAGGYLYFSAIDKNGIGRELWKTDGTVEGTELVKDINPGPANSTPDPLAAIGDIVLLAATDATNGRELWRTDGTKDGTTLVKDIRVGPISSFIRSVIVVGDRVFFDAADHLGREPWVSDGTTAGTFMLKDIRKGFQPSQPGPFFATSKKDIWFAATSDEYGRELWRTDGTAAGTTLAADIIPGPVSSDPEPLGIAETDKPRLLLAATDWVKGRELFALDLPRAFRTIGHGCAQDAVPPSLAVDMDGNSLFAVGKLSGHDVRPNSYVFVLVAPKPSQAVFFPGCSIHVGYSFAVLGPFQANNGKWESVMLLNVSVPGASFAWQGIVWPAPGPLGFDTTNGVITTFGG